MGHDYRTFGSFILFREARHDELGRLYRAGEIEGKSLKRMVWLRAFDAPGVAVDDLRAQLDTARQITAILKAANVVSNPVHFDQAGVPALAFDHVPAQPLGAVFEKVRADGFPVPVDNALLILEKLALGLSAALAVEVGGASLVHGFLHPGLILVTNDGEGLIMGFGLADQFLGLLDRADTAAAIRPYLAPEVLVSRSTSKRGDVYSLGAILYELLTGQPLPAAPEARAGILDRAELAYDEQPIPEDIKALLGRALASRPEERFSSAADFKKELDKLLYGGAYSPTTFNLALFMDRLFRAEIEADEREIGEQGTLDLTPYLAPEPKPEPEPIQSEPPPPRGGSRGLWIGIAAAAVVIAGVAIVMTLSRGPAGPVLPPTPTAEELAEKQRAEDERLQAMIQDMVQQRMAEKEEEIRQELLARQSQIEDLRRRLTDSERGKVGQLSDAERRARQELQQQIAAAEAEQRQQEEALERERLRVAEEERLRVAAQRATATAAQEAERLAAVAATPTPPPAGPPVVAEAPTATPAPAAPAVSRPAVTTVTEGMFVDPSEIDAPPVVLREHPVSWSRVATMSRRRGMVIMQVTVNAGGGVDDVKVLRTDDDSFGIPEAVVEAVRKYRFKPGTKNGVKITTNVTVTMRYNFLDR